MKGETSEQQDDLWGDPLKTLTVYSAGQLVLFFLWGIGLIVGGGYRLIDVCALMIARTIAWMIVGVCWLPVTIVRLFFVGLWRVVTFVVVTVPVFCARSIGHAITIIFDGVREQAALLSTRTYNSLQRGAVSKAPPTFWWKKLAAFAGILLLFALPFPAIRSYQFLTEVRADTTATAIVALDTLQQGVAALQAGDAARAQSLFGEAHDTFERARSTVTQVPTPFRSLVKALPSVGKKISDGEALLDIGLSASTIGLRASGFSQTMGNEQAFGENFFQTLTTLLTATDEIRPLIFEIDEKMAHISPETIPDQYREQFETLKNTAASVNTLVGSLASVRSVLLTSLGAEQKRRYLLLFQNNAELRPTGGFIGSYALIDVYRGKLIDIEVPGGGSYDLQGQLSAYVRSPQPLHLVNSRWEFQDANWFPDFPTSAQKVLWFYEQAGGPTVDGVIAVNAGLFERLLDVVGSIPMQGYGKELNANNFFLETHKAVELEYDKEKNKPKQFIADLFPAALDKIGGSPGVRTQIAALLVDALARRDIQVFLRNSAEQDQISRFGISGSLRDAPLDYFMLVSANIGGAKSDMVIDDALARTLTMHANGSIEAQVTLTRKHGGKPGGDPFTGVANSSYLRFYFPRGTTLLDAKGFAPPPLARFEQGSDELREDTLLRMIEGTPTIDPTTGMIVTHEFNKSVFAHWLVVKPGEEGTVSLTVRLPFTVKDLPLQNGQRLYSFLLQRQSGSRISSVTLDQWAMSTTIAPFVSDATITTPLK